MQKEKDFLKKKKLTNKELTQAMMGVIQDAMRFTLDDGGIRSYMGTSTPEIADLPVIPDGPEGEAIYNALPSGSEYVNADGTKSRKP